MPEGFFTTSQLAQYRKPPSRLAQCGACGLYKTCHSPKMPVTGHGARRVLIVAEAPGKTEDERGVQLIGEAGQLLRRHLRAIEVNLDEDCWKTNSIICWPGKGNPAPTDKQIDYCRPILNKTIADLKPVVIILLGAISIKAALAPYWHEDFGTMARWAGWQIPLQPLNTWVCPTYHPSYLLREEKQNRDKAELLARAFRNHLKAAFKLTDSRPWERVPDYASEVNIVLDTDKAARYINEIAARGAPISFDFETNMLKPDSEAARIISCAVCVRGKRTLAYPWHGLAVDATTALLQSPCPKVGANIKFEQRWAIAKLGTHVRRWVWDTMNGAHVCDNRGGKDDKQKGGGTGISSVAFQSFARLGLPSYDAHIKPAMRCGGTNTPNRVAKEIELRDLLRYNALDALCEYRIAQKQVGELNYPLEL